MPFVAKKKSTGERIVISDIANPRQDIDPNDICCQFDDCNAPMLVKCGLIVRPHFSHRPAKACTTLLETHPESTEHRVGKLAVATWLRDYYNNQGFDNISIEFEVAVKEAGRVADIMVTFPGGMRHAHEIQLAGITTEHLERRTKAYWDNGIATSWWIGKDSNADTPRNREWIMQEHGELPIVSFNSTTVEIAFGESDARVGEGTPTSNRGDGHVW